MVPGCAGASARRPATGTCTRTLEHGGGLVWCLTLVGAMVVSGGGDGNLKVWSLVGKGECVATLAGHSREVWRGVFSCFLV